MLPLKTGAVSFKRMLGGTLLKTDHLPMDAINLDKR